MNISMITGAPFEGLLLSKVPRVRGTDNTPSLSMLENTAGEIEYSSHDERKRRTR